MSENMTQRLDPLTLPLFGERLIEASAGTGKTYTIAALYLRLLLGLGGEQAYARPLGVDELLVVTFTEAATEELRGRIRANIHDLRIACIRHRSDSPLFNSLLLEIADKSAAARVLLLAEQQMDEAAIFTIHGFCQRMLSLNAFESGMLFDQQLLDDESALRFQACADFWRRHCYPLPKDIVQVISEEWAGPQDLLKSVGAWLQGEAPNLKSPPADNETLISRHQDIIRSIESLKGQWRAAAEDLLALISDSGVDKRSYSSKHLPNWLAEVGQWAQSDTVNYRLPTALGKFSQETLIDKTKKGVAPQHPLFVSIEHLLASRLTLRDLLIARALGEIRANVQQEKQRRGELGFDDMLSRLDSALHQAGGERLANAIRQRFPVALIDEFQDTDPQQYRIFSALYLNQPQTGLLLIGDPKQAIYAFRGADIFTYIKARNEVKAHYTLDTNWRSSPTMIAAVNHLFQQQDQAFLFKQIPFLAVNAAASNQQHRFTLEGESQPGLTLWLQPGEGCGVQDYQQTMARFCAQQICHWLTAGQRGEAMVWKGEHGRPVTAADITVLVRSRHEASLIRDALSLLNIPSVYLSSRDSVFTTPEARELLWILQAVLSPDNEMTLRRALGTALLGLDALAIDSLNKDEAAWDRLVEEFIDYRQLWLSRGVMPMIRALLSARHIAEDLLATPQGERRLTDILHLSELLQEASIALESEHALTRWFAHGIAEPDTQAASQQLRLESDKHLVQVVTIHKSKGLEYALVWLPFLANYRVQNNALYHDRTSLVSQLDLSDDADSLALAEEERLAEDLRLLYVALTRAIWHCSVGIAPLFRGGRSKKGPSDFHRSALGYLIQQGAAMDAEQLSLALDKLKSDDIAIEPVILGDAVLWQPTEPVNQVLATRQLSRDISDNWRITSYSGLQQHGAVSSLDILPRFDQDASGDGFVQQSERDSPHTFPRGALPGTFLHTLFEQLDFSQPIDEQWLAEMLRSNGYSEAWLPVFMPWLNGVLQAPLNQTGVSLSQLSARDKRVELAFYLPIETALQAASLDNLVRRYDPLSEASPALDFRQVKGMLKGFIDLVFRWEGRYYLLDYKSNWLGEDSSAYTPQAMAQAMQQHRYDLQYQLYTLALHRYLRHRIPDYQYQQHFGGVIYLFLRGIEVGNPEQGIFSVYPDAALIDGMDALFSGFEAQEVLS